MIHANTVISSNVRIFQGVTLGRADLYRSPDESDFEGIVVEDFVVLGSGAKVLGKEGILRIGYGTIVGANAVLLESTGENEIYAGIPARKLGRR